ncbi:MAG TPA: hypothetical protein VNA89_11680, partial [Gemmatimonadaceae bacterium]|nr:hypothetical protein [Gemmatimonadaceae bacterium]
AILPAMPPRPPSLRPRRLGLALIAATLAVLAGAVAYLMRDPTTRMLARRSRLAAVQEGAPQMVDGQWVRPVRLRAGSGLEVELLVRRPGEHGADGRGARERRALVVILGGHNTGREAARLIPDTRGTVVAALSYPYRGEHRLKGLAVLRYVPAIREAVLDAPPAVMLALDYLLAQPDVDPRRVEGVGVSLGVPFVTIAGALDERFTRVWAIHGGAGSYEPLEHNLRRNVPLAPARAAVAGLSTVLIAGPRIAAERWAGRIAPRPFCMVNAVADERVPRPLAERLYASARAPKALAWVSGGHVRSRPEVVRGLVDLVLDRVVGPAADAAGGGSTRAATVYDPAAPCPGAVGPGVVARR